MPDVLHKQTPRENCVKYQDFSTQVGLSLSLECSGEISRQSVKSAYHINLLKVDVLLQKSNARSQLVKVRKQLAPNPEIITPNKTANQWKNRTSQFLTIDYNFPGKASHCNTFFQEFICFMNKEFYALPCLFNAYLELN